VVARSAPTTSSARMKYEGSVPCWVCNVASWSWISLMTSFVSLIDAVLEVDSEATSTIGPR
jgi:hypothetical protein